MIDTFLTIARAHLDVVRKTKDRRRFPSNAAVCIVASAFAAEAAMNVFLSLKLADAQFPYEGLLQWVLKASYVSWEQKADICIHIVCRTERRKGYRVRATKEELVKLFRSRNKLVHFKPTLLPYEKFSRESYGLLPSGQIMWIGEFGIPKKSAKIVCLDYPDFLKDGRQARRACSRGYAAAYRLVDNLLPDLALHAAPPRGIRRRKVRNNAKVQGEERSILGK